MSSLEALGESIAQQTKHLAGVLRKLGVEEPGFGEEHAGDFEESMLKLSVEQQVEIRKLRANLINSAKDVQDLTAGPTDQILSLAFSSADLHNLGVLVQFDIPKNVPLGGKISAKELAHRVQLPLGILIREVRFAIGTGIFTEPEPLFFAHSAVSARLAQNEYIHDLAMFCMLDMVPVHVRTAESLKQKQQNNWEHPVSAFNTAHPEVSGAFEWFQKNPDAEMRYHKYLNSRINTSRWTPDKFARAWDWAAVEGTIIDVGGSAGHSCLAIAPHAPKSKFIVQDVSEEALEYGRQLAKQANLSSIVFEHYDFFKPQPRVADVYIFRHILHDWDDQDSIAILASQVPAMRTGARVLISETVMPEGAARRSAVFDDKQVRAEDILMLSVHNACERTVGEYTALVQAASPKFKLVGVSSGAVHGAFQSLIEYEFRDE